jgi:hypothetical protein
MKKQLFLSALCLATYAANAQSDDNSSSNNGTTYEQCKYFFKTPPLRDMLKTLTPVDDEALSAAAKGKPINPMRHADLSQINDIGLSENGGVDPVLQSEFGTKTSSGYRAAVNVNGLFGAFPPDPSGAAGPNYYVQAVNSSYRVFDKTGSPETPAYALNTLWDRGGAGDPIVMYDRFAERWFISQFYGSPDAGSENGVLIAVSETSDPLGAYYAYEFGYTLFPDFPKYAVWSNAYFMSANSASADCSAFERDKMLVGDPTAGVIKMNFPDMYLLFNSVTPAYAEGPREPEIDEPCYFFAVQDNSYPGVSTDHIKILKATINWAAPLTSNITEHQELNTAIFNSVFSGGWTENITQKGTTQRLDAIPGIFMYRAQYRRFADHNTMMLCHNVNVGGNRSGMRWYELRDADDGIWSIYQQGTYAPDSQNSRWLGNLAMDAQGNIAMAYCFTGTAHHPGIRYTGRFKDDPLGEMTVPELTAVEGQSAQTDLGRYGDYSQMAMDPTDDMTFWFTGQYLGTGESKRTRIFSFSSWHIAGVEDEYTTVPVFNAYQPQPHQLQVNWNNIADQTITLSVHNSRGRLILTQTLDGETNSELIEISETTNGIYILTLTGENTNLSRKIYLGK